MSNDEVLTDFSKVSFFWPLQVIFFSRKSMPTVLMNLRKEKSWKLVIHENVDHVNLTSD